MSDKSTFLIVGAGGVGGLLGGFLARAGHDVAFVARGAQLAALRERGLTLRGPDGEQTLRQIRAAEDPASLGPVDYVLISVKAWQIEEVAPRLRASLRTSTDGHATAVVPLQNGVDAAPRLAHVLGEEAVVGGLCHLLSWIEAPGVIVWTRPTPMVTLGARLPSQRPVIERLGGVLGSAGIASRLSDDIEVALWEKLLFLAPFGSVGAVTRALVGVVRTVPETRRLLGQAMEEIAAVARARGVELDAQVVDRALARVDAVPPDASASTYRDILSGRPSELGDLTGAVVRMGQEAGVPTPTNDFLFAALTPQENAARSTIR